MVIKEFYQIQILYRKKYHYALHSTLLININKLRLWCHSFSLWVKVLILHCRTWWFGHQGETSETSVWLISPVSVWLLSGEACPWLSTNCCPNNLVCTWWQHWVMWTTVWCPLLDRINFLGKSSVVLWNVGVWNRSSLKHYFVNTLQCWCHIASRLIPHWMHFSWLSVYSSDLILRKLWFPINAK